MAMTDDQQEQAALAPEIFLPAPSGETLPSAGTGLYNSSLIQALRQASPPFTSSNPGVTMMPNQAAPSAPVKRSPAPTGLTFNPPVFTMPEAPAEDIFTETDVKDLLSNAYDEWAAKNVPQQPAYSFNDGP